MAATLNGHEATQAIIAPPVLGNGETSVSAPETIDHPNGSLKPSVSPVKAAPAVNGSAKTTSYPQAKFDLIDRFVDEPRKLRVVVIGGGLAGILSGCLLPKKVPGIELVIYEKNPDFVSDREVHVVSGLENLLSELSPVQGGTWFENVYPGETESARPKRPDPIKNCR